MLLTRDVNIDWNQVPDPSTGKLLPGFIQMKILDYEEKMTSSDGVDKDGNPKIAKYMLVAHLEAVAPGEVEGMMRNEYFVVGSNDDPLMQKAETFYRKDNYGASGLKGMLNSAQVPWSASLVSTLQSSIGALFILAVKHKNGKRRDTGEAIVEVGTGRTFKVGEKAPQIIPCGLPLCDDCKALAGGGGNTGSGQAVAGPGVAPPVSPAAPPVQTVPAMPPVQTIQSATPVTPVPMTPPVPPVISPAAPVKTAPVTAATPAPPAPGLSCKMCGKTGIPQTEFAAHVVQCAQGAAQSAAQGFKQEA